ncbi:SusC/RagA family TonB-linked outer membrane protein [Sphingobacterium siyangense]|uniref:SusC/RagA family TonB-linked outer membrane protein n=1 Tax=Sphingobacterium siyangense TaxID=459529 RepID=A0A420FWX1_9SPHI|nr:SusC/RagA family TonB-linked outer membrane protein [Sphingobacterium siyangense]
MCSLVALSPQIVDAATLASYGILFQQELSVSGTVHDETGMPIPGVTVSVNGTSLVTKTDNQGKYKLDKVPMNAIINFRMVGKQSMDESVKGRHAIDVTLLNSESNLEEVVVVGYGKQRKETVTGAVATVKGSDLAQSPALNVSNALTGRVPGVTATNGSAEPGYDGSNIKIRGTNTLGNSSPLVVIDGVPAREGGIDRINPRDIENISVLKDASAAIYGARAANGVILVTTRRGKTGKPQFSYTFNQGYSQPTVIPKLTDASQFAEIRNELEIYNLPVEEWSAAYTAINNKGSYNKKDGGVLDAPFKPEDIQKFKDGSDPWGHPNTDWYKSTLKDWSPQQRHNLQINGGTEDVKYLMSLGYQNQDAYYKNSATGYKQYDLRINLDANISQYVKTQFGVLGRQENRSFPTKSAGTIFRMLMRGNPTQPAIWPNGKPGPDIENGENPVVITTNATGYDRDKRYYFQTNGQVDITNPWIDGLKLTLNASVDKYVKNQKTWVTPWTLYSWQGAYEADGTTPLLEAGKRGPADPNLNQSNEDQLNILLGGILSFERKFGDHQLNVIAGVNRETINNDKFSAYRRYFLSNMIDYLFAGGDAEKNNDGTAWDRARLNYFGRFGYNYKSKYIAEFLWRRDGSYMFPADSRYGFFPGAMAGWVVSEENFWKENIPVVNYFKIRASYGQMGNDNIYYKDQLQEYQYFSTYSFGNYVINDQLMKTLFETRVPNELITWEVANNYNLGFDFQFFQGKLNFEFDIFKNRRNSILWQRNASVPQSTGMTLPAENIGKVDNKGWEFNLGYKGKVGELGYTLGVNGGYAKNKIIFWDEAPGAPAWQQSTGKPIKTDIYYVYDGVFRDMEDIANNKLDYSAITKTLRPGDMKYQDFNGDGKITPDDKVRRDKNSDPTFQGGFNFSLSYKDFDLSVLFQGATGGEIRVGTDESGSIGNFLEEFYEKRWSISNPSSVYPRLTDRSNQYYSYNNTYWMRSTDYLRLKNVEVGYNLPSSICSKIGIGSLRVYANGMNLITWSKIKMYDPEAVNALGQYYPQARLINAGVLLSF